MRIAVTSLALIAASCAPRPAAPPARTDRAIASQEGKFEFALDAPWRIEPRYTVAAGLGYSAIPIQISIHNMNTFDDDAGSVSTPLAPGLQGRFGDVISVEVKETTPTGDVTRTYALDDLHEVEYVRFDRPYPDFDGFDSDHQVCKRWQPRPPCEPAFRFLGDKSEWHATLFYSASTQTPGADVPLRITLRARRLNDPTRPDFQLVNSVRVHLGEAALPKFDDGWAYGDVHYHSQGTNNDGETAYAYRGVLQAMAALGLDFAVASEHASNSEKLVDLDYDIDWPPIDLTFRGLRDMSPSRFKSNLAWLNSPSGGANHEVLSFAWQELGIRAVPQIFLGGEVDTVPEITDEERQNGLKYGNGLRYLYWQACNALPWYVIQSPFWPCDGAIPRDAAGNPIGLVSDDNFRAFLTERWAEGTWGVKDVEGLGVALARQHMVHIPTDGTREDAFVESDTSTWGGGTRHLKEILDVEYAQKQKGLVFLAHPLSAAGGSDADRLGPDIVPYSETELRRAFASQSVLGLQLWNEDARHSNPTGWAASETDFVEGMETGVFELKPWYRDFSTWANAASPASALHHGSATWDKMLLWGLDKAGAASLPWLNGQVRRVFMAGGSDAHGDLNYRRQGALYGTTSVDDTAIGKPRNLVFTGLPAGDPQASDGTAPRPYTQTQVTNGLRSGQFSVTDGPALRIAVDVNRNGVIDSGDLPMGSIASYALGQTVPLVVEWKSSAEFGHVTAIDLYVGVWSDDAGQGQVWANADHGVRGVNDPAGSLTSSYSDPSTGRTFWKLGDSYWYDSSGTLRIRNPSDTYGQTMSMRVELDPTRFPVLVFDCNNQLARSLPPSRFYVRAFARTDGNPPIGRTCRPDLGECTARYAYANPVWVEYPNPWATTAPRSPIQLAPAYEDPNQAESVRIEGSHGHVFERGYNSVCYPRSYDPWGAPRSIQGITDLSTALGWSGLATVPISPVGWDLLDGGKYQHFSNNASIYFNPHDWSWDGYQGCAYTIQNGIRDLFFDTGYEWGTLGYPITNERYYDGGAYQYFDNGAGFWKSTTGTTQLNGAIARRHLELMRLGLRAFPTASQVAIAYPPGTSADLEGGRAIYASPSTPASLVSGAILDAYRANAGPSGLLYPTGEQRDGGNGWTYQQFQNAAIWYKPAAGTCVQSGTATPPSASLPGFPAQ
jgi:hypothetical protein